MAVEIHKAPEGTHYLAVWSGPISDAEPEFAYRALYDDPEWDPALPVLTDLSGAELKTLSGGALRRLGVVTDAAMARRGVSPPRSAIFGPEDLRFGIGRMYTLVRPGDGANLRVFRDRDAALTWLLAPASLAQPKPVVSGP
ncbi:MAG: hypothetical protein KDA24_11390 [Deltaproteobacteria bacterium]|nr:hypothetical protein [Deltaproteobacteria bacterium]